MTSQDRLWIAAIAMLLLAGGAAFADWRRTRRHRLDAPGWVPWPLMQIFALFAALALASLATWK